jgi:hypothetical protein
MVKYNLVNPAIEGDLQTSYEAKNSVDAANFFYNEMSQYFNNHVPNFMFSFQKGGSANGKLYHYKVSESRNDNEVSFKLREHQINDEERVNGFRARLATHRERQAGGKKHKSKKHRKHNKDDSEDSDSSSSSSDASSSDEFLMGSSYNNNYSRSIHYWWYDPYDYNMQSLFLPTFYSYVTPYVELSVLPTVYPLV